MSYGYALIGIQTKCPEENVQMDKTSEEENVRRHNFPRLNVRRTKCLKGKNERPWDKNVRWDKMSGWTKMSEGKRPVVIFSAYI
jgi:hypothetical protein